MPTYYAMRHAAAIMSYAAERHELAMAGYMMPSAERFAGQPPAAIAAEPLYAADIAAADYATPCHCAIFSLRLFSFAAIFAAASARIMHAMPVALPPLPPCVRVLMREQSALLADIFAAARSLPFAAIIARAPLPPRYFAAAGRFSAICHAGADACC